MDKEHRREFPEGPVSRLPFGSGELVLAAAHIFKELHHRPELATWHKGRVILIGDAHLGQGANQAMEGCYRLTSLLLAHNPFSALPATVLLQTILAEFEGSRIALMSEVVNRARKLGELHVVGGVEGGTKQNEVSVEMYGGSAGLVAQIMHLVENPFEAREIRGKAQSVS